MKLTPAQQRAIEQRGSHLLLAASAGSGKTEVLARRCVDLIADPREPCGINELLVATFTRAAAAELRVRIGRMLRDAARDTRDDRLRRHLRRQEVLVESADISTIDAWCKRIVREHAGQIGIDPAFALLGEHHGVLLRRQVLDRLMRHVQTADDELAERARAWVQRVARPSDTFLRERITGLNRFREHLINPDAWLADQRAACERNDADAVLAAELRGECAFQINQLDALLESCAYDEVAAVLRDYRERLDEWQTLLGNADTAGNVAGVVANIAAHKFPHKKPDDGAEILAEVSKRWHEQRLKKAWPAELIDQIVSSQGAAAELMLTLLDLEQEYEQRLQSEKQRLARYEFADVQRLTLDLLGQPGTGDKRAPTTAARALRQRYAHVLVDEFQDTSPVQVEILRLVSREPDGPGNRFMVGDVKQSIYGFRQAEPRLFSAVISAYAAGDRDVRVDYLSDNFRSHAELLGALNEIYARLFDRSLGGTAYGQDERLAAGRAEHELANPGLDQQPRVAVHLLERDARPGRRDNNDDDDNGPVLIGGIEREAQRAAEQINALLADRVQIPERAADQSVQLRPVRLSDIVILLRSAQRNAGLVARVLRANGIRCVTGGRESLLASIEVGDVCAVLQLLVNRHQDVPLAAYLRGPLTGLTPADLLGIRAADASRTGDFCDAVEAFTEHGANRQLAERVAEALARIDRWATLAREVELTQLLQNILSEGNLILFASGQHGGEQRVAMLRSLQGLARQFVDADLGGVPEFVDYLDQLAAEEIEPGALAVGDDEAVRIMTIHGAKGLEFPVVFLLGTGAKFNRRRQNEPLQCDRDAGAGLKFADYPTRSDVIGARWQVGRLRLRQRELEEELRLLYVATTRARERLVIMGHVAPGTWDEQCVRLAGADVPALVTRMSVQNLIEWVLMAIASGRLYEPRNGAAALVEVTCEEAGEVEVRDAQSAGPRSARVELRRADQAWIERTRTLLASDIDRTCTELPAVLSVSALKEATLREAEADRPRTLDHAELQLPVPRFAAQTADSGRQRGTAVHHFLERADLSDLATPAAVQGQLDVLVGAGRFSADEAALVPIDDVVWLGCGGLRDLFADLANTVRREVPFVYALPLTEGGERSIIRGIIDVLVETPAGLVLLDYKTDVVPDEATLKQRLAGYAMQLRLYAAAAGGIFARPVSRATLVFLSRHETFDVAPTPPTPEELCALLQQPDADANLT